MAKFVDSEEPQIRRANSKLYIGGLTAALYKDQLWTENALFVLMTRIMIRLKPRFL